MSTDAQDLRRRLEDAIKRAETDEQFRSSLERDPASALSEFGLDSQVVDMARGRRAVDPELIPALRCNDLTCWSSECPGSCYVTICGSTYWW